MILKKILLILVAAIIVFGYFYKLDNVPPGFYVDEATYAYNAYSILKSGKDEFGKFLPIIFRFYGSFNATLYVYLTSLSIYIWDLSVFSARFGSVLAGLLSIIIHYLILRNLRLFKNKNTIILSTLLFAITPWLFFYSRIGYEIVLGYLFFSCGALFFLLAQKKEINYVFSFLFLALSTYSAYSERYVVLLALIPLAIVNKKNILKKTALKYYLFGIIIFILLQIPYLLLLRTPAFFTKEGLFYNDILKYEAGILSIVFPYKLGYFLAFSREFISKVLTYLSPRSLFFLADGDMQRSLPDLSVFYQWMLVPYLVGLYKLFNLREKKVMFTILVLIFASILPAALTLDPFSTHRVFTLLLPLSIVISLGLDYFLEKNFLIFGIITFGLIIVSLVLLWRSYFVLLPNERANYWGYGIDKLANIIAEKKEDHFLIDKSRMKPIYINLAFYLKYPPEKFHRETDRGIKDNYYTDTNYYEEKKFSNLEVGTINWSEDIYKDQILVGDPLSISEGQANEHKLTKVFDIKDPRGEIILVGFKTNPAEKCRNSAYKDFHCVSIK